MTTSTTSVTVEDLLANAAWARRLASNLLHDGDSADDLVQETWITALKTRPDREQPLRPWLARVLRNRAANRGRDESRRQARHVRAAALVGAAAGADPEELLSRVQVQRLLADLITALPEPARQTVILRYYEGLTSEQIGEVMGVAAGTVRRRLKEAVDELRDELDRRHQGNRDTWLRALLPLALDPAAEPGTTLPTPERSSRPGSSLPPAPGGPRPLTAAIFGSGLLQSATPLLPKLAAATLVLGLAAGGLLLAWPSAPTQPSVGRGPAAAGPSGNVPGGASPGLAAALPLTLDQCRDTLAARRRELAPAEAEYLRNEKAEDVYERGTPNPTARAALLPDLERLFRGDAAAGQGFSLVCRTLACYMGAERSPRSVGAVREWLRPLQTDPALKERVRRHSWRGGPAPDDPDPRPSAEQVHVFLLLKETSGARIPATEGAGLPAADSKPPPTTLPACRVELEATQRRLAYLKAANERDLPPNQRFARSPFNPSLAAEFGAVVTSALKAGGVTAKPEVVCRGRVCQVSVPGATGPGWRGALGQDRDFHRYMRSFALTPDGQIFYDIGDPERPEGARVMMRLIGAILRSPGLAACSTRFPTQGHLQLRLIIPDGERPERGVEPGRIRAQLSGPLADTLLGRCVEEDIGRSLETSALPDGVRGVTANQRLDFPWTGPSTRPATGRGQP